MEEDKLYESIENMSKLIEKIDNIGEDTTPEELEALMEETENLDKIFKSLQKNKNPKNKKPKDA